VNSAGTVAVGVDAGAELNDAYLWSATEGVRNLGGDRVPVCFFSWVEYQDVCRTRRTIAYSVSDDASVITGESSYSDFLSGAFAIDGVIYTPKMGWMKLSSFLQSQGVLEATNWVFLGAKVSASGRTIVGTAMPLGADYYQGFRVDLDQVYVCHGQGKSANTLRVAFPSAMDQHLAHGDTVGICPGQGPI
jgi:hypothetical protein